MLQPVGALDELDRPIYGAKNIGAIVNLTARQAHHALHRGYLDADKFGRKWRSTKRRLLKSLAPQTHSTDAADSPPKKRSQLTSYAEPPEQSPQPQHAEAHAFPV